MKSPAACLVATYTPLKQQRQRYTRTPFKTNGRTRVRAEMSSDDHQVSEPSTPPNNLSREEEIPVRMEVSNSVMRMLQGKGGNDPEVGVGLIEMNQRKRNKQMQQPQSIQADDERAVHVRDELFSKSRHYVPKHDTLFPLFVATFAILSDDDDDELSETVDRFSSDFARMKEIVEKDVIGMKSRSLLASQLFCDVNGDPLNVSVDMKFERWFLLSMYVKFKLWWKGPSSAADVALEYAYRMCNFVFDADGEVGRVLERLPGFIPAGRRLAIRYGRLFMGKLNGEEEPSVLLERLQKELDMKKRGWVAFLMASDGGGEPDEEVACLVTHRTSLIFFNIPQTNAQLISAFLLFWSAVTSFNVGVGQVDSVVEQCAVPLGMLAVVGAGALARRGVASVYGVSRLVSSHFIVPVGQVGAIPSFVYYTGCLPNRACLFDLSAATSIAGLALSALLIFNNSHYSWLPSIMVPSDMFSYSGMLTWLLEQVSTVDQGGGTELVVNPLTLGALLGLNFTVFSLLPVTLSDGGRVIGASFGRRVLKSISRFTFAVGAVSLLSKDLMLGSLWALTCAAMPEDSFQRDEITEPGVVRKVVALLLTAGAVAAFFPPI